MQNAECIMHNYGLPTIELRGLDLDAVWANIVADLAGIELQQGQTLDEQLVRQQKREKLLKEQFGKDDVTSITFPCPIGSDYWYVEPEKLEVRCVKGGIRGFAYHDGQIFALVDERLDMLELHDPWCCLSKKEAEMFREQLLSAK